jgi:hypothetical protein
MSESLSRLANVLAADPGVDREYRHMPKRVTSSDPLEPTGAILKWYALAPEDRPVSDEVTRLARAHISNTRLDARGFGFVILHRCGGDFYFLILSTWRGNNELWETVFYKDGEAMADFAPFPREGSHKPTYCVWEMAAVEHERKAWTRFLLSARDDREGELWLDDCYTGAA